MSSGDHRWSASKLVGSLSRKFTSAIVSSGKERKAVGNRLSASYSRAKNNQRCLKTQKEIELIIDQVNC